MMNAAICPVSCDRIDDSDLCLRITTEAGLDDLVRSIREVGLLHPPVLHPRGADWGVVAGFRRIRACRRLEQREILCRTLPAGTSPFGLARIAIADNIGQRRLNPLELSRAYRLLASSLDAPDRLPEAAARIGLPSNPDWIEKLQGLCRLPEPIQRGVMTERISLSVLPELERMPEAEAVGFAQWFLLVPLSLNRQREVMTLVREIARRENLSVPEVLDAPAFSAVVDDPETEGPQKGRRLLQRLRQRRFPELSRAEADFEKRRKRLPLAEGMTLLPPKNFEGGRFVLKLSFARSETLEEMLAPAGKLARSRELKRILGEE